MKRQGSVVGMLFLVTVLSDRATGKMLLTRKLVCLYQLALDKDDTIKITRIMYFEEGVPPGTVQIEEIYGKEPGMAKMFSQPTVERCAEADR